jgi:tRNA (guanine-N7-)-methyltransferase
MSKRYENNSSPTELLPGDIEYEMGTPIPGVILRKEQWVQTAIKRLPDESLQLSEIFARSAPIAVDIGCGNGRFTISSAVRRPDWDHIGIDILPAVIRYGTRRGNQRGLSNVRFAVCDGWRFLEKYLPKNSVNEFHIYHPQPYADPTLSSRRMLTPEFMAMMHERLSDGGQVYLQSDRREYWDYIKTIMERMFVWHEVDGPWPEDEYGRSRREVLSVEQGLKIYRGVGTKRSDLTAEEMQTILLELPQPKFQVEGGERRSKRTLRKRPNRPGKPKRNR